MFPRIFGALAVIALLGACSDDVEITTRSDGEIRIRLDLDATVHGNPAAGNRAVEVFLREGDYAATLVAGDLLGWSGDAGAPGTWGTQFVVTAATGRGGVGGRPIGADSGPQAFDATDEFLRIAHFSLFAAGVASFYLPDFDVSDNRGGLSLEVTRQEPVTVELH